MQGLFDMQCRPAFGGIFGHEGDQHDATADQRYQTKTAGLFIRRADQAFDPATALEGHNNKGGSQQRHDRHYGSWRQAVAAQCAGAQRTCGVAKGIAGVTQVHQWLAVLRLQRRGAGVHQHIHRAGARTTAQHGQREHPQMRDLSGHRERRRLGQGAEWQRPSAQPCANDRGRKHGHHGRNRRHDQQQAQTRLRDAKHGFQVGQIGGKGAPQHPHGSKNHQGRAGNRQNGAVDHGALGRSGANLWHVCQRR